MVNALKTNFDHILEKQQTILLYAENKSMKSMKTSVY